MQKGRNLAKSGLLSLTALLLGCQTSASAEKTVQPLTSNLPAESKEKEPVFELVPYADYNPRAETRQIYLDEGARRYIYNGLDANLEPTDKCNINNYFKFKKAIYQTATELGYTQEEVLKMSPREAIELTCEMVAHRVNYFGVTQDARTKFRRKREIEKIRSSLNLLLNDSDTPENHKVNAQEKIERLDEAEKKWREIELNETTLSDDAGYMVKPADSLSVDELFEGKEPVVCRHYVTIVKGTFTVLKADNPNLANTYVSYYVDRKHIWNQVCTVITDKEDGNKYTISFFDPTWDDLSFHREGYDKKHFPDTHLLEAQSSNLPGKKIIMPLAETK